jgi:hypothetical protein
LHLFLTNLEDEIVFKEGRICRTQNPILETRNISPKTFELKYHLRILILFMKLTSPKTKIVANKDLIKVPYPFVKIYTFIFIL